MKTAKEFMQNYFQIMKRKSEEGWRFCSQESNGSQLTSQDGKTLLVHRLDGEYAKGCVPQESRINAQVERGLVLPEVNLLTLGEVPDQETSIDLGCTVMELEAKYELKRSVFGCTVRSEGDLSTVSSVEYNGPLGISWEPPIKEGDSFPQALEKMLLLADINFSTYHGDVADFADLYGRDEECFYQNLGFVQGVLDVEAVRREDGRTYVTFSGEAGTKEIQLPNDTLNQDTESPLHNPEKLVGTKLFVRLNYWEGRTGGNSCAIAPIPEELYG